MSKKNFIAVAMSGGIDSTVTAWILKKLNYPIVGIFIINWTKNNNCKKNLIDLIKIVKILNIKLKILNYKKIYNKIIIKKLIKEYKRGKTPNPDIECNKKIKFKILLNYITKFLKIKKLATGHYAKIVKNKKYNLFISKDANKDQTYFLHKIKKKKLSRILFPLGNINKKEVREIAKKINLPNKYKKDSYGICLIEENNFKNFINIYVKKNFGYIINEKNKIIGLHDGITYYTIGQRKKIKIENKNFKFKKNYIFKKNKKNNIIYVTNNIKSKKLLSLGVLLKKINWLKKIKNNTYCKAKIRHSKIYILCLVRYINKLKLIIKFNKLQWGVAEGQSIVFYKKNLCLGGGIVNKVINI